MNILFLAAYWLGFDMLYKSLASLGEHEIKLIHYDRLMPLPSLVNKACEDFSPDAIIYVGVNGGPYTPSLEDLKTARKRCPLVCISPEASDQRWWWPRLTVYKTHECFDLIVNIDGCEEWPGSENGLTLLTPIDPIPWGEPKPWNERTVNCGFSGSMDSDYRPFIFAPFRDLLTIRDSTPGDTYGDYREFMRDCRLTFNTAMNANRMGKHVKGRVLEAGLAASLLLEDEHSPTRRWFVPGEDYLEWTSGPQIRIIIEAALATPEVSQAMAENLRQKVLAKHTPKHFWSAIFDRLKDRL